MANYRVVVLVASITVLMFSGCALFRPKLSGEYLDPEFTRADLVQGRLILGPVTSIFSDIDTRDPERSEWGNRLWSSFASDAKDVNVAPADFLIETLGHDYFTLESSVEKRGKFDDQDFDRLREDIRDNDAYIMLVRFDDDNVSYESDEKTDSTDEVISVTLKTRRELCAQVRTYNVVSAKLVWSGHICFTGTESKKYNADSDRGGGWFGNILYDALVGNSDEYPEQPPFADVAEELFTRIARALPVD